MRSLAIAILVASAGLTLAGACGKDSQPPGPNSEEQLSQAREMFTTKCSKCHGINGAVNGLSSDSLSPRPHKYTDPAWQASVSDEQIKEIILRGGVNMGMSPAMPGYPTLRHRPELLDGLVKLIRSFAKPAAK
jgi:mono/diheme cytochrome c family protein